MSFDGEAFGHRVKTARVWARLSAEQLAQRLGVSDEAIYQIERGERKSAPKKLQLEAMARELSQSKEWLLSGAGAPWLNPSRLEAGPGTIDEKIDELLDRVGRVEAGQRDLAAAIARLQPARAARQRRRASGAEGA